MLKKDDGSKTKKRLKKIIVSNKSECIKLSIVALPIFIFLIFYFVFPFTADYRVPCSSNNKMCFCEQNPNNNSIIHQPSNTGTCFFYMFFGIIICLHSYWNYDSYPYPFIWDLVFIGTFTILIGIFSSFYHAFTTDWGSQLDGFGMYLYFTYIFALILARSVIFTKILSHTKIFIFQFIIFIIFLIVLILVDILAVDIAKSYVFGTFILIACIVELINTNILFFYYNVKPYKIINFQKKTDNTGNGGVDDDDDDISEKCYYAAFFPLSIVFLIFGFIFWFLETDPNVCNPTSVFQFHSVWHFFTALAFLFIYFHIFYTSEHYYNLLLKKN